MENNLHEVKIVDDINETSYNKVSVENFGEMMLEGMMKSKNYLKKKRKAPDLIEFEVRNSRKGLGYKDEENDKSLSKIKKKEPKSFYGENILIIDGNFKGKKGKVLLNKKYTSFHELCKANEFLLIELNINGQKHEIKSEFLELYDLKSKENQNELYNQKETIIDNNKIKREKLQWIKPNIIIRIIDENSKYYNTKAKVEDIIGDDTFLLLTNDNTLHSEFFEEHCETYIPKLNNPVLILNGKHENKKGILLLRDKEKNIVNVQLYDELTILVLTQDDICAIE